MKQSITLQYQCCLNFSLQNAGSLVNSLELYMASIPKNVQLIGTEVAISWSDGTETFFSMEFLRANSPSAENTGEPDIFGRVHGGDPRTEYPGVTVTGFDYVGRYAICFTFSDGHNTGLFTYDYLRELADRLE